MLAELGLDFTAERDDAVPGLEEADPGREDGPEYIGDMARVGLDAQPRPPPTLRSNREIADIASSTASNAAAAAALAAAAASSALAQLSASDALANRAL